MPLNWLIKYVSVPTFRGHVCKIFWVRRCPLIKQKKNLWPQIRILILELNSFLRIIIRGLIGSTRLQFRILLPRLTSQLSQLSSGRSFSIPCCTLHGASPAMLKTNYSQDLLLDDDWIKLPIQFLISDNTSKSNL